MQVTVQDMMSRSPLAVRIEATIDEVLRMLVTEAASSVYVTTSENRLAGVVTDYELLKLQVLRGDRTKPVETLMSRNVPTVYPEESAQSICPKFRDGNYSRMAVVDAEGRLIGNLTRLDVMCMMLDQEQRAAEKPEAANAKNEVCADSGNSSPSTPNVLVARVTVLAACT